MSRISKLVPASVRRQLVLAAGLLPSPDVGRLCVLTSGRSGSELLVELLDSHPQMRCEGEIFTEPQRYPMPFVRGRMRRASRLGAKAWGFKFIPGQAASLGHGKDMRSFVRALGDDGFVIARLRRDNLLRQAISQLRAAHTDEFHVRTDAARGPVIVDPTHLVFTMRTIEIYDDMMDEAVTPLRHVSLTYEGDLEDGTHWPDTLGRIFPLVGIEPAPVASTLRKQNPRSLADAVENAEQVRAILSGTRYERFLFD